MKREIMNKKEEWFAQIITDCDNLNADEKMTVEGFGKNGDLVLKFDKDYEFNRDVDEDYANSVFIVTEKKGIPIDDSGNVHILDLWRYLDKIWNEQSLSTL